MNPYELLKQRQVFWALRHGKSLVGQYHGDPDPVQADRGQKLFTEQLDNNLFEPLMADAIAEYKAGDGRELEGGMKAVHSSAALVVNAFHYWRKRGLLSELAKILRIPSTGIMGLRFEAQYPIHDQFPRPANLDAVFEYGPSAPLKATAIECKFLEPYSGWGKQGLRPAYLEHPELWEGLPNLREIAGQFSADNTRFLALDAPQLLKHTLGLTATYGKQGFRLLYLYYLAPGAQGVKHAEELAELAGVMEQDGIRFQHLTYQELLLGLARHHREGHREYVDYLVERYL